MIPNNRKLGKGVEMISEHGTRSVALWAGLLTLFGCGGEAPSADDSAVEQTAVVQQDLDLAEAVRTPVGLMHPSCVHQIAESEEIDDRGVVTQQGRVLRRYSPCKFKRGVSETAQPTINGWIENALITAPFHNGQDWFNLSSSSFNVPANPTANHNQLVYFFPSFGPTADDAIIQPVLQWGPDSNGGGQYWQISSWFIDTQGNATHTSGLPVASGQVLDTRMQMTSSSGGIDGWKIQIFANEGSKTLNISSSIKWRRLHLGVLEAYRITACSDLPSTGPVDYNTTSAYMPDTAWNNFWPVNRSIATVVTSGLSPNCSYSVTSFLATSPFYQTKLFY